MHVLHEDNHLLVVVKPANMPTQADSSGDMDLLTQAKGYIKEKYEKPGAVYLGLVHRLDRPVGGIVCFARTSKAAARLCEQLRERSMHRGYLCIAVGETPPQGTLSDWLHKDERTNTSRVVKEGMHGAKWAQLRYEQLAHQEGLSLLRVALVTGRSHQIRVQCAHAGFPLWGDARYGEGQAGMRIALFADKLTCIHPTLRQDMHFRAQVPNGPPWDLFSPL